jgi:cell division protein FtsB
MVSKDELTGMFGVSSANLIPVLTKAVQELKAENDRLKARLEALEAKVGK